MPLQVTQLKYKYRERFRDRNTCHTNSLKRKKEKRERERGTVVQKQRCNFSILTMLRRQISTFGAWKGRGSSGFPLRPNNLEATKCLIRSAWTILSWNRN